MAAAASARRAGSPGSGGSIGLPDVTSQKRHPRVQVSPAIMKVAVPRVQQRWMLGHEASSHTVTRLSWRIRDFSCT